VIKTGPLPQGDAHTIVVESSGGYIGIADHRISGGVAAF
jgi:hypothetical protein